MYKIKDDTFDSISMNHSLETMDKQCTKLLKMLQREETVKNYAGISCAQEEVLLSSDDKILPVQTETEIIPKAEEKANSVTTENKPDITEDMSKNTKVNVGKVKSLKVKNSKSKKVTVSFKKISGAKYEIQYSTNKKFKKRNKTKLVSENKATISKLKKGKKYYFRVRAYKKANGEKVYGAWSAVKSVKIKK